MFRLNRWHFIATVALVGVIAFSALWLWRAGEIARAKNLNAKPVPPTSMTFKKAKFLDGQQSELISHLGLTTGTIEVDVGDAEVWFKIDTVIWEEGKKPKLNGSCDSPFKGKSKLSFAIRQLQDQEENHVYAISVYDKVQDLEGTFRQNIRVKKRMQVAQHTISKKSENPSNSRKAKRPSSGPTRSTRAAVPVGVPSNKIILPPCRVRLPCG